MTLSSFMDALRGLIKSRPAHETGTFKALVEQMRYFAGEGGMQVAADLLKL